jgi:protein gp37
MSDRVGAEWIDQAWLPIRRCTQAPIHGATETWKAVQAMLEQPLAWRRPRRIVVGQDLFRTGVPFDLVDDVFDVMRRCRQHHFLVVTRNPERLLAWRYDPSERRAELLSDDRGRALPNVWITISAESLLTAHGTVAALLEAPAQEDLDG